MKCRDIIKCLDERWPESYALGFDNVGLLVGDKDQEVHHIFAALDVTDDTLAQAIDCGADMIITHHPLLFSAIKRVTTDDFIGNRIVQMVRHGISYYAMHTNFDIMGMASLNAVSLNLTNPEILEVTYEDEEGRKEGIGRIGTLEQPLTLKDFGIFVKEQLGLDMVRVYGDLEKEVSRAAISSGSGRSMVKEAIRQGAEVLVTGDIDYHTGIDAVAEGLMIVDAGHYGTEMIFIEHMEETLKEMFPNLKISAAKIQQPFSLV